MFSSILLMYYKPSHCRTVVGHLVLLLCKDRIFAITSGRYRTIPYPFGSPFLVTIALPKLQYRVNTHLASRILLRSFPCENMLTMDWLSNSIQLLGMFDLFWFEHTMSWWCRNKNPSYSLYLSSLSASVSAMPSFSSMNLFPLWLLYLFSTQLESCMRN